ncbi:hypothetical protein HRbin36_01932 [bacterium HR36]|nr:hypothetical protein HRbin36_01932 [bacterium HR36]
MELSIGIVGGQSGAFRRADLQRLRTELRLQDGQALPHAFVRHAEDQTIAALAVALQTLRSLPEPLPQADRWGVLAAPEYFGREATFGSLRRYSQEGPSAISPHLIPNHCLHSLAGSLSVLLGCHGPNYGVGGGPNQFAELLWAGLCETAQGPAPGYWLVATGWRQVAEDFWPATAESDICLALALAVCRAQDCTCKCLATLSWRPWPTLFDPERSLCETVSLDTFIRAFHQAPGGSSCEEEGAVTRWYIQEVGVLEFRRTARGFDQETGSAVREVAA